MTLHAIDIKTGEIKGKIASFITPEQKEKLQAMEKKQERILRGNNPPFVMCFHDSIREVTQHLSLTESGAVMKLLLYMKMSSEGLLQHEGKPLKQSDIQKILRRGKSQTTAILNRLENLSLLSSKKEGRSKQFYINHKMHHMGKLISKKHHFTKLWKNKLREVVGELKLEELGFLYKILPYFHYDSCILAHNPNEPDEMNIRHMNRKALAAAINYDLDNLTALVKRLKYKGLIMTTTSRGNIRYYVHPDLMYRQDNDGNNNKFNSIRSMFEAHRV